MSQTTPLALNDATLFQQKSFINDQWHAGDGVFDVRNPANGKLLAQVANATVAQAQIAVDAAQAAFPSWAARTGKQRAEVMRKWFDLITAHTEDLAHIMTAEQGKPVAEARGEVAYAASFVEWFAEEAKRVSGSVMASTWTDKRMLTLKQPIGVCVAITPWNFPLGMITRKVAPAIAAGCSIIIKPAEQTPLSALALVELARRAGLPAGVLSVVTADSQRSIEIGKLLCASKTVRHISFTGSTPVGRILMQQSAPTVKKMALELGGHAPFIVFEDADLEAAVEGAVQSKYRNAGQTCVCTNRFYVHSSLYDAFVSRLATKVAELSVGDGFTKGVVLGPLIDAQALEKVAQHVQDAVAKGARLLTGGKAHALGGYFYEPTVLADVNESMLVMTEETFGPVAAVMKFDTEAEAIAAANDTDFGLASYFYSRDIGRVWRVAEQLDYGMVGINTGLISNEVAPFGGVKQSGLGREGSSHGMDEYLEMKYLCMGGI